MALAARTLYFFVVLYLPALAAAAIYVNRDRGKDMVRAGLSALTALGLNGWLIFFLWFWSARVGRLFALVVPIASAACLAFLLRNAGLRSRLGRLFMPIGLSGVFSLLILSAGFSYGGLDQPYETAWTRFSHRLPPDNTIPYIFAEGVWNEHISKPMIGDWRSSDRPPLQSGLVLAVERYYAQDRKLSSDIAGVLAQSTWILAFWLFLTALDIETRLIAIILAAAMASGFVLVNTFFVWPKLFAGAFVLGALTAYIRRAPILCGACIALAMLAHGGSIFAFLGAIPVLLMLRLRMPLRSVALLIGTAAALYMPWLLYQKLYDPPGDRLPKMHLAGIEAVDPRPVGEVIRSAYAAQTSQQIYSNKLQNLDAAKGRIRYFGETSIKLFHTPAFAAAHDLRVIWFFDFIPTLSFWGIGIPLLLVGVLPRFRTRCYRIALAIWLFIVITDVVWCLVMFGPHSTVLHQGTYAPVLLGFAACCLSIWSASRLLAIVVLVLQAALTLVVYGPFCAPPNEKLDGTAVLIGCAAFAAAVALLYCIAAGASGEVRGQKTVH